MPRTNTMCGKYFARIIISIFFFNFDTPCGNHHGEENSWSPDKQVTVSKGNVKNYQQGKQEEVYEFNGYLCVFWQCLRNQRFTVKKCT